MGEGGRIDTELEPPAVDAGVYDRDYYLHSCMGADAWRESRGQDVAALYHGMLARLAIRPGDRLLDIGTGRGELPRLAVEHGAAEAVGVDYSAEAVELAREAIAADGQSDGRVRIERADARRLPVAADRFDLVTLLDVVEHLDPTELDDALREALRALRPGGRIFIHTAPSSLIYDVTYRLLRLSRPGRRGRWPAEPRNQLELRMHVNEQRSGSLRRALRGAGFTAVRVSLGDWIYADFVPERRSRRVYRGLARVPWLRRLAVCDLFAAGRAPG